MAYYVVDMSEEAQGRFYEIDSYGGNARFVSCLHFFEPFKAELHMAEAPPARWKTPEREAARKEARAAKLAALEERRRAGLKRIADDLRERIARNEEASRQPSLEPPPGVWRDASYFAREARRRRIDTDVSDLV